MAGPLLIGAVGTAIGLGLGNLLERLGKKPEQPQQPIINNIMQGDNKDVVAALDRMTQAFEQLSARLGNGAGIPAFGQAGAQPFGQGIFPQFPGQFNNSLPGVGLPGLSGQPFAPGFGNLFGNQSPFGTGQEIPGQGGGTFAPRNPIQSLARNLGLLGDHLAQLGSSFGNLQGLCQSLHGQGTQQSQLQAGGLGGFGFGFGFVGQQPSANPVGGQAPIAPQAQVGQANRPEIKPTEGDSLKTRLEACFAKSKDKRTALNELLGVNIRQGNNKNRESGKLFDKVASGQISEIQAKKEAEKISKLGSPLVFDLAGAGLHISGLKIIKIDLDHDGTDELITDIDNTTGLLFFDAKLEQLDEITGAHMFGDNTDLSAYGILGPNEEGSFDDGFQALRVLGEFFGLIDESKSVLTEEDILVLEETVGLRMRVGSVIHGENRRLTALGITEIKLGNPEKTQHIDEVASDYWGNKMMHQEGAQFTIQGQVHRYADIWFNIQAREKKTASATPERLAPLRKTQLQFLR